MAPAVKAAQRWLTERLRGLAPDDFVPGVRFHCTQALMPPPAFRQTWSVHQPGSHGGALPRSLAPDLFPAIRAIVVFGSLADEVQFHAMARLVEAVDAVSCDAPPVFWVPHTAGDGRWPADAAELKPNPEREHELLALGLDGIVCEELAGFALARSVRAQLARVASIAETFDKVLNERRARWQRANDLKQNVDSLLWEYVVFRMVPSIPTIDYALHVGELRQVDGFRFEGFLGRGVFGRVFKVTRMEDAGQIKERKQVVKLVPKSTLQDLPAVKRLGNMIQVMQLLSSEGWRHPNVVQLHRTYHSPTHFLFRMEYGGPENLYHRLRHRELPGENHCPLPLEKAKLLLQQLIEVIAHLHTGPHVCHRDLKPENICLEETPAQLTVKLADFDLALVQEGGPATATHRRRRSCSGACGTVPFAAPEVLQQPQYDGMAADMWSMAVVFVEVMCGVRIVERVLDLDARSQAGKPGGQDAGGCRPNGTVVERLRAGFQKPGSAGELVRSHSRAELAALVPALVESSDGMLRLQPSARWRAQDATPWLARLRAAGAVGDVHADADGPPGRRPPAGGPQAT